MSCPVHAVTITETGTAYGARARVKGAYFVGNGTAGSLVLRNGSASGTVMLNLAVPAAVAGTYFLIPEDGILCETNVHATLTNVSSATIIYE